MFLGITVVRFWDEKKIQRFIIFIKNRPSSHARPSRTGNTGGSFRIMSGKEWSVNTARFAGLQQHVPGSVCQYLLAVNLDIQHQVVLQG
jgi:hypothetical protein